MVNARRADGDDGVPSTAVIVASAVIRQTISARGWCEIRRHTARDQYRGYWNAPQG